MERRTALVTGAGIGLGKASAEALAEAGYRVIVTDVLRDEGEDCAAAIRGNGGDAEYHYLDVSDSAATNDLVAALEADYGALSALVLNAGIARTLPLATLTDEQWDETLDVNLKGMMRVLRAAAPGMKREQKGAVVCLSSIVGSLLGWSEHIPYASSKGGVAGLVRAAALELAPFQVRVNGIAPGVIRSAQTLDPVNSLGEAGLEAFAGTVPLGRVGDPADIADVAVFLLSDKARYLTGQVLAVDGGTTISL
ncbi:SDR family NAD(P)-dependent oxidoreductase [Pseudohaliea rubra]|uniref:3-oxoacyl-[acyl-carrier protein] reductase n=1 Tax=Pseudohaliea rubra DSM 19751 TaxID=1265313 RepID=A0A095XXP1_9GAMM|nr:SDR family NAD(P)-dependent oxidoreductase [Pseudohaliea rubra]KGE04501.1 3-oxoacyl-[acyl-carrier protein] reductase [Pseudohaliea rubra DSM 19751]